MIAWAAFMLPALATAQHAAEIVSIKGRGEHGRAAAGPWIPAKVQQKLEGGTWLRTQQDSKVALLFTDETTTTVFANSLAQVRQPDPAAPRRSIMDFQRGKARIETKTPARSFSVTTPTGLAAIRGTEWLVEVADDGSSSFTVVEGEVELSNDRGTLLVAANEQGFLERGKAPYKRRVQNARERIQWVSQLEVRPSDYAELAPGGAAAASHARIAQAIDAGDLESARGALAARIGAGDAAVDYFLLADIALYRGEAAEAIDWLRKAAARFPAEPRTQGLLARAYLFADDMGLAREAAAQARARHPKTLESQLHAGEVARLDGDYAGARAALREATRIAPQDWRAWHALGRLYAERSDPRRARRALDEADRLSPRNAAVLGERGLLEANAYCLPLARATLADALAAEPADFSTWQGLGVTRLRSGDLEGALEALRKATALEPRSGRAHVYLAVAYWQQGRADDALAELRTASVHDPKDPLPYQFASIILSDLMRPGDAAAAAREAMARLAYTKSLDAIANNLRGGANLGTPLAQMGLEAWALKNAQDSFDPLWAGSHLFLADRLPGKFAANSELFQGFLSDPLAFGTSNRFQPLVQRPGHYGTLAWRGARSSESTLIEPLVNVNGLMAEGQVAYFAEGVRLKSYLDDGSAEDRATSGTLALGLRASDAVGLFLYANRLNADSRAGFAGRSFFETFQLIDGPASRVDGGLMYRHGPDTQLWVKAGGGSEQGTLASRDVVATASLRTFRDSEFSTRPRRRDYAARGLHRLPGGVELSLAAEYATFKSVDFLERDAFPRITAGGTRLLESVLQDIRDESTSVEVALRSPAHRAFVAELQVDHTRYDKTDDILVVREFASQRVELEDDYRRSRASPRVGAAWRPIPQLTLRAAYQEWLRPASIGSLRAPSTAGIVLDERYVLPGGRFERARAQAEWQPFGAAMLTVFYDRQEIDNLFSELAGVLNNRPDASNLERLRNRSFNPLASLGRLEGFAELSRGELTERGFAMNAIVSRQLGLFAEGTWASSENTSVRHAGKRLAFLPERRIAVGGTFFSDRRWSLAASAVHRGERFTDEANTRRLREGWSGALQAYWESVSKRWSAELIVANLGARDSDESVGLALNYRF